MDIVSTISSIKKATSVNKKKEIIRENKNNRDFADILFYAFNLPDVTVPGTHWIDGATQPTKSGEYFVILEAKQDGEPLSSGKILFKKGDIEITSDWYSADRAMFDLVGMDNPVWRVRSWAKIQMPVIPENVRERVRWYFGEKVKHDA